MHFLLTLIAIFQFFLFYLFKEPAAYNGILFAF